MNLAVVGATGRTGRVVVAKLAATEHRVVAVGRSPDRLAGLATGIERRHADLEDPAATATALADAHRVASLAPARFTSQLLAALPTGCQRLVLTGSTRRDTSLPDPVAEHVRAAEAAFERSGVPGVVLHAGMIYGGDDDRNIDRVLQIIRRWPAWLPLVVPLPGRGRHTVQPIFVDDLADAVVAALLTPEVGGSAIMAVGPEPISYATVVRTCAAALGRRALVVPAPSPRLMGALARALRLPVDTDELLRTLEDKQYDPGPLTDRLGVTPRSFEEGLRIKLGRAAPAQ